MPPRLCFPGGLVRVRVISGTPDTFDVKAIVPLAKAASGLPEGASVTDRVSTTSAYISLDVCRTFARLHGRAGVFEGSTDGELEFEKLALRGAFLVACQCRALSHVDLGHEPREVDAS